MKTSNRLALVALCSMLVSGFASAQFLGMPTLPSTLHVGDPAPELKVARWVKGKPVAKFEPGHVYVVEFWATWCGPCKQAMPHLSELQKQYVGKATFIGVDVWEHVKEKTDEAIAALVVPFVESQGDRMAYTVAMDGADGWMGKNWVTAAGHQWIPDTFVVNGEGKIAWIGMPGELDRVLPKVIDGSWDIAAEKKRVADEAAAFAAREKAFAPITAAKKTKDPAKIIEACDAAIATSPSLAKESGVILSKLEALYQTDGDKSVAYVKELATAKTISPAAITRSTPKGDSAVSESQWKEILAALSPVKGTSAGFLVSYSYLLEKAGDREAAATAQKQAIEATIAEYSEHAGKPVAADQIPQMKEMKARLESLIAGEQKTSAK